MCKYQNTQKMRNNNSEAASGCVVYTNTANTLLEKFSPKKTRFFSLYLFMQAHAISEIPRNFFNNTVTSKYYCVDFMVIM